MKKLIALLGILSGHMLVAQVGSYFGGSGHFSMGSSVVEMNGINTFLNTKQLPGFSRNCISVGGGGFGVINNFIIGGEGGAINPSRVANTNGYSELSTGYGAFNFGYMIPLKSRFMIYPMGGMGWGGSDLTVFTTSGGEEKYNSTRSFISTEINCDLYMIGDKEEGVKAGFKAGLCIGYLFNLQAEPWKDQNKNYSNAPTNFVNGFYFKLKIGGGGIGKASK